MRRRVLVTGGAGFIGAATARMLLASGVEVRVLDDLSTGSRAALPPGAQLLEADLRAPGALEEAMEEVDAVLHLAGRSGVERCAADPEGAWDVNVAGTALLLAAARGRVERVVLASSAAVHAEHTPSGPHTAYADSKRAVEALAAQLLADEPAAPTLTVLRYFNVYGPGQRMSGPDAPVIGRFLGAALAARPILVQGDGLQRRDFVHVEDVARANLAALLGQGAPGTYEVGTGRATSILELVRALSAVLGRPLDVEHRPARPGDPRGSVAETRAAFNKLGWRSQHDLHSGLSRLLQASSPVSFGLPCMLP